MLQPGEMVAEIVPVVKEAPFVLIVTNLRLLWTVLVAGQLVCRRECSLLLFVRCDRPCPTPPLTTTTTTSFSSSSSTAPPPSPLLRLTYILPPPPPETHRRASVLIEEQIVTGGSAPPPPSSPGNFLSRSLFKVLNSTASRNDLSSASAAQAQFVQELPPLPPAGYAWSGYVMKRGGADGVGLFTWKRRWCRLAGNTLSFYNTEQVFQTPQILSPWPQPAAT
jgi:hypothetical protein